MAKILIVEDSFQIREAVTDYFVEKSEGSIIMDAADDNATQDDGTGVTARWIDSNLNFSHDADDFYYVDDQQVSMKDYYGSLNKHDVLYAFDSYSTINSFRYLKDKAETDFVSSGSFITEKEVILAEGGDWEPEVKGTIPQINGDGGDIKKVNEEIEKFAKDQGWQSGLSNTPNTKYMVINRAGQDGSWTLVWFFVVGNNFVIKPYTFDANNRLMTCDEILNNAGCDDEFMEKVERKLIRDLELADIYYLNMNKQEGLEYGLDIEATYASFQNDPDVFINAEGIPVIILDLKGYPGSLLRGNIPYACEFSYNEKDKLVTTEESDAYRKILENDIDLDEKISDSIRNNLLLTQYKQYSKEPVNIKDINTKYQPADNGVYEARAYGAANIEYNIEYGMDSGESDKLYCRLILSGLCRESGDYKFEIYKEGKAVVEGVMSETADPYYQIIEFKIPLKEEDHFCAVIYDRDSDDMVLGAVWFNNIPTRWGD